MKGVCFAFKQSRFSISLILKIGQFGLSNLRSMINIKIMLGEILFIEHTEKVFQSIFLLFKIVKLTYCTGNAVVFGVFTFFPLIYLFIYNWIFQFRSAHHHLNADTTTLNIYSAGK